MCLIILIACLLGGWSFAAAAENPGMPAKELAAAKRLFSTRCAKCHDAPEPKKYPESAWAEWMIKMSRKAKLTPAQADQVQRYVEALRAEK